MFKRVLVLIIFLFGVFWWLTNREVEAPNSTNEVITVESETTSKTEDTTSTPESEELVAPSLEIVNDTVAPVVPENSSTQATPKTNIETETGAEVNPSVVVTPVPSPTHIVPTPAPKPTIPVPTSVEPQVVPTESSTSTAKIPNRTTDVKVYVYASGLNFMNTTLPAGTINFTVINSGNRTHDFNISGYGNLGKVTPSQTQIFTLALPAGEYEAFSERGLDAQRGVRGNFTVIE